MNIAEIFGNGMVLQQGQPIPVWGTARAGEKISVKIQERHASAVTGEDGTWCVYLEPLSVSCNETMIVSGQSEKVCFENVAVGEVWIAAGQSNMEFHMRYDRDYPQEVSHCSNPNIRFYDTPVVTTEKMRELFNYSETFGFWRTCNAENLQWYSAVGYYFAKYLEMDLNVPIGIIGLNCGGSRSVCWMDEETASATGAEWLEDYENGLRNIPDIPKAEANFYRTPMADHTHPFDNPVSDRMMYGIPVEELAESFKKMEEMGGLVIGPWHEWRPCGLYHTMVERVCPYTVKGVLWYQGESDEDHPHIYAKMLSGLISLWRRKWNCNLPFIVAQLAPLGEVIGNGGREYPVLRSQQDLVSKTIPDVFLASTGDVGSTYDIHPKEKQPVGRRMALLARGHVYNEKDLLCDAPVPDHAEINDRTISVYFKNAAGGLILKGDIASYIEIVSMVGERASVETVKNISVRDNVLDILMENAPERPLEIRFAQIPYYHMDLYNKSDVPALPFILKMDGSLNDK